MIKQIALRVEPRVACERAALSHCVAAALGMDCSQITAIRTVRRSIDARQRKVMVSMLVDVFIGEEMPESSFTPTVYPDVSSSKPVIIVGAGPGGLFAALRLIELGYKPIVVERGRNVRDRKTDLASMSRTGHVDHESNYCFGEGGAGAYSDGKLYTRSKKRGSVEKILNVFCQHGAPADILVDAHPHIGTDKLPRVIENIRKTILSSGGEVHFRTRMTNLLTTRGFAGISADDSHSSIVGIEAEVTDESTGEKRVREFMGPVILATGHSARDVYRYLYCENIAVEAKGIAVGVRLEHPAHLIDQIQYHSPSGRGRYLPAAEYSFVTQVAGRGVYSFCMCPGGFVIPAATDKGQIVVNGMSPSSRGGKWSNSGMVVELRTDDVAGVSQLRMLDFQEQLEKECFRRGNGLLAAPAQRMADFVSGRQSSDLPPTSYTPGVVSSPLHQWLPKHIRHRLQEGFSVFGRNSRGFLTNDALMIGVETRTSSPVRILRTADTLMHPQAAGLFPCGEGAGYAGGIVSAAIDGERCADMCAQYYSNI